jgi:DNA-binding transcriptional MerR regulator
MSGTTPEETRDEHSESGAGGQRNTIQEVGRALDEWRAKIDELIVQLDLANLDIRDEIRKRLDTTENVYLAARSLLSDARHDAGSNLSALRLDLDQLMRDIRYAYDAAESVVRRGKDQ